MSINLNIADAVLTQTNSPAATAVSITAPNNIAEGDLILICASITANNSSDGWDFGNLPTGFSSLQQAQDNSNWSPETAIFVKVATASEPASYSFGLLDDWDVAAYALRVSGVDTANISANSEIASTVGGTSLTFSGGDSTTSGNVIVYATALGDFDSPSSNQSTAITPPAGVTKQLEYQADGSAERINLAISSEDAATETIGTRAFTWTNADNALGVWVELTEGATAITPNPITKSDGVTLVPEGTAVEHLYADDNKGTNETLLETKYTDINGEVTFDLELPAGKVRYLRTIFQENGRDNVKEQFFSD